VLNFPHRWNFEEKFKEVEVSYVSNGFTITDDVGACFISHFVEQADRVWVSDWVYKRVMSIKKAVTSYPPGRYAKSIPVQSQQR
jgi:hypothetical protein